MLTPSARGDSTPLEEAAQLNAQAELLSHSRQPERALPLAERAISLQEAALGPSHPQVAWSRRHLALLYQRQGAYAQAERLHRIALQQLEASLGPRHPEVVTALTNLAWLSREKGDIPRAEALLQRAIERQEGELSESTPTLPDSRVSELLKARSTLRDTVLTWALDRRATFNVQRLAMATALLRKGRAAGEVGISMQALSRASNDPATTAEVRARAAQLRDLRRRIVALYQEPSAPSTPQSLAPLLAQRDALEERALRALSAAHRWHAPPVGEIVASVARSLPVNGALLDIEVASIRQDPNRLRPDLAGEPHYLALLLFPDQQVQVVDLGRVAVIDRAAAQTLRQIAHPSPDPLAPQGAAMELYQLVMDPLASYLDWHTRLFLCPDGQLNLIPFAALHDGKDWLLGRYQFTYLTSGTSLLQPRVHEPRNRSVVIFADPVFQTSFAPAFANRSLVTSGGPTPGFAPLAGTRMEAKAIQGLWRTANLFLGAQATKATLLDLHAPGILHLATHGVFLPGITPALVRSALALAPSPGGPGARREDDRSSLVSALEVTSMDLWGTQLVVLSACESGIGDVQRGEGVVGLRRSFFVAGTETLVSSLWTQYIWVVRLQGPLRVEVSKLKTLCEHLKRTRTWPSRHRSR